MHRVLLHVIVREVVVLGRWNHQGKFGADYVRVLASAAGLVVSQDDLDVDGADLRVKAPGPTPHSFSPSIELQVKTVLRPRIGDGALRFDGLTQRGFNRLAGDDHQVPRHLVVVLVPRDAREYAHLRTEGLLLQHTGYHLSLADRPRIARATDRAVPLLVPTAHVLTAEVLRTLVRPDVRAAG